MAERSTCARCHEPLADGHRCRRPRESADTDAVDFFLGGVLGGSIGILLFGMIASLLVGRGFDTAGLVIGSVAGLTLVRASRGPRVAPVKRS